MENNLQSVLQAAMRLDASSQIALAEQLLVKLSNSDTHFAGWIEESERRRKDYLDGKIGASDADESLKRLRSRLNR